MKCTAVQNRTQKGLAVQRRLIRMIVVHRTGVNAGVNYLSLTKIRISIPFCLLVTSEIIRKKKKTLGNQ